MATRSPWRPVAALNAALVRYPAGEPDADTPPHGKPAAQQRGQDLRLFGVTWLAGFVFFLAYLS